MKTDAELLALAQENLRAQGPTDPAVIQALASLAAGLGVRREPEQKAS